MNKKEFEQFIYDEFPTVFENNFSREMLCNILNYAEEIEETEQCKFLYRMIPEITQEEIKVKFNNI